MPSQLYDAYNCARFGNSLQIVLCDLELSIATKGSNLCELPPSTQNTVPVTSLEPSESNQTMAEAKCGLVHTLKHINSLAIF